MRKKERVRYSGVICQRSMEVPEMPLSYKLTGARNIVTPTALIQPARKRSRKFIARRLFSSRKNGRL